MKARQLAVVHCVTLHTQSSKKEKNFTVTWGLQRQTNTGANFVVCNSFFIHLERSQVYLCYLDLLRRRWFWFCDSRHRLGSDKPCLHRSYPLDQNLASRFDWVSLMSKVVSSCLCYLKMKQHRELSFRLRKVLSTVGFKKFFKKRSWSTWNIFSCHFVFRKKNSPRMVFCTSKLTWKVMFP